MIADGLLLGCDNVDNPTQTILLCLIVYFYRAQFSRGVILVGVKVVVQIGKCITLIVKIENLASNGRTDEPTDGWMYRRTYGRTDTRTDGRTGERLIQIDLPNAVFLLIQPHTFIRAKTI